MFLRKALLGLWLMAGLLLACQNNDTTKSKPENAVDAAKDPVLAQMEQQIAQYPDSVVLVDRLIDTLSQRNETDAAAAWCDTLLQRDTVNNLIYSLVKADLYRGAQQYPKAIAAYEYYLQRKADEPTIFLSLANTMAEAGDKRVLTFCPQIVRQFPTREVYTGVCYVKGIYYNTIKEYAQARAWMDSTIRYDYAFTNAYMEKGFAWFDEGNAAQAAATFAKLVEIDAKNAEAWYWLGKSEETAGRKAAAIKAYERCVLISNKIPEAKEALERLGK
ncbi:tetratricopeptide repeat protein [Phnomibacter sp. MR]|uniref:tetratricopeptide repeat protein n=1 Tax=Phnomibacter sp. MR TaxID=3042318 RepID=UPI003A7F6A25